MRQPKKLAILLCQTPNTSPLWVKTPLVLPKLWQSYSVASYNPLVPEGREGLGEKGGAFLKVKEGRVGFRKNFLWKERRRGSKKIQILNLKQNIMIQPKISVVTVCYNAVNDIEKTILSVIISD